MPFVVTVDVSGNTSVTARFQESDLRESFICTKFKIQWSTTEDFSIIHGERELLDVKDKECCIGNLNHGQKYYFRAAAGNIKGYSRFRPTTPAYLTPSSQYYFLIHIYYLLKMYAHYDDFQVGETWTVERVDLRDDWSSSTV